MAFDNWKREKTITYRRIFKEEQKKIHLEQAAKAEQMAKKETANKVILPFYKDCFKNSIGKI